jgi:hypothetical protein
VLYINKHIICQRYFSIKDFNEKSLKSYELKLLMDRLIGMGNGPDGRMGIITSQLKKKSVDYLWKFYNPYNPPKAEDYKNNFEKEDFFDFEIITIIITISFVKLISGPRIISSVNNFFFYFTKNHIFK